MAKSPNAEDCSSNQAIFLELKKIEGGGGNGTTEGNPRTFTIISSLTGSTLYRKKKKRSVLMNGSFEGKKKKAKIQHLEQKQNPQTYRRIFLEVHSFLKTRKTLNFFFLGIWENTDYFFFCLF